MNFRESYAFYEEDNLHTEIPEVAEAETQFSELLKGITDSELRNAVDMAAGRLTSAYEKQGFAFAEAVYTKKAVAV